MLLRHTYIFRQLLCRFLRAALYLTESAEDFLASRHSLGAPAPLPASMERAHALQSRRSSIDYKLTWWKFASLMSTAGCLCLLSACSEKVSLQGSESAIASKTLT